jgi:O-antigen/teichoic acid export membrane protein
MIKSEKKNVVLSFLVDSLGNILVQIIMIMVVPIYLNYVSELHYGYWLTILSVIAWITLTDLGIGMALTRELIKINSLARDEIRLNKLISTAFFTFFILGLIFFGIGGILYFLLPELLSIPEGDLKIFNSTYIICIVSGALVLPFNCFSAIIESNKKLTLNRSIAIVSSLIGLLIGVILIVFTEIGIMSLAIGMLLKILFQGVFSIYFSLRVQYFNLKLSLFDKTILKRLFSFGGYLQVSRIANTVAVSADNIIITFLMGAVWVTPYNLTVKLANFFGIAIASKIPIALFPSITSMVVNKEFEKLRILVRKMLSLLTRLSLFAGCFVYFINEEFVTLWVGGDNFGGFKLNLIFVYWILFETIVRGTTMIIYAFGDLKKLAIFSIYEAVSNLVLSLILGKYYGLVGVALATALSRTFTIGIYLPSFLWKKKLIDYSSLTLILNIILLSVPMAIALYILHSISIDNLFLSILLSGIIAVIINLICFDYCEFVKVFRKEITYSQLPEEILKKYVI